MGAFFAAQVEAGSTISLDGKTLRGTIPPGASQGVHLLAAYCPEAGVVLRQVEVGEKTNEIGAAPDLLDRLDLGGQVVTADALLTQRSLCDQIVTAGGDYVLPVKNNQPDLLQAIADSFVPPPPSHGYPQPPLPTASTHTCNSGHGRLELRYLDAHPHLNAYLDWPHLAQVFRLQRLTQDPHTGRLRYQVVFGITSLSPQQASPQRLLHLVPQHWRIENCLHYVRDVSFHEDACQIRQRRRQRCLTILNNLVLGLIQRTDFDFVPQARRFFAFHFDQALPLLL